MHVYTLQEKDIGSSVIKLDSCAACGSGKTIWLHSAIGRVQRGDIGLRVYEQRDNAGQNMTVVESRAQRDRRGSHGH